METFGGAHRDGWTVRWTPGLNVPSSPRKLGSSPDPKQSRKAISAHLLCHLRDLGYGVQLSGRRRRLRQRCASVQAKRRRIALQCAGEVEEVRAEGRRVLLDLR